MKLKYDFEKMEMDDEVVAVPVGDGAENFHGVLKLNDSAEYLLDLLKQDTTEEKMIEKVKSEFDTDDSISAYIHDYIETLRNAELLTD